MPKEPEYAKTVISLAAKRPVGGIWYRVVLRHARGVLMSAHQIDPGDIKIRAFRRVVRHDCGDHIRVVDPVPYNRHVASTWSERPLTEAAMFRTLA
jgi:hypothetical protein